MLLIEQTLLSNAALVVPLAILATVVTRFVRRPAWAWAMWGLVLLKFVTPATVPLPVDVSLWPLNEVPETAWATTTGAITDARSIDPARVTVAMSESPEFVFPSKGPIVVAPPLSSSRNSVEPLVSIDVFAPSVTVSSPVKQVVATPIVDQPEVDWRLIASVCWLMGSVGMAVLCVYRVRRFRGVLQQAESAPADVLALMKQVAASMELKRLPAVRVTAGRLPPLLWAGLGKATILLPDELLQSLDDDSRRTMIAHELTHYARHDHWTRWLEMFVRCLFWWHPVAWWAGYRLREVEEQCCDARVVRLLPDSAKTYAHTLLATVEFLAASSLSLPALATGLRPVRRHVRPLHRRLQMIVEQKTAPRLSWLSRMLVLGLAVVILPAAWSDVPADEATPTASLGEPIAATPQGVLPPSAQVAVDRPPRHSDDGPRQGVLLVQNPNRYIPPQPSLIPPRQTGNPFAPQPGQPFNPSAIPQNLTNPTLIGGLPGRRVTNEPRPRVNTSEEEYEVLKVVTLEYELPTLVIKQYQLIFAQVEEHFPILLASITTPTPVFEESRGGFSRVTPAATHGTLRVLTTEAVQKPLKQLIESLLAVSKNPEGTKTYELVRASYTLPSSIREAFVSLLNAHRELGVILPVIVKTRGDTLVVTAPKETQAAIRGFVELLSERWQPGEPPSPLPVKPPTGFEQPPATFDLDELPQSDGDLDVLAP